MSITVIIPTYNRCQFLYWALQSVHEQTLMADEIIVVDDGSDDATEQMLHSEFPDVKYLRQQNSGVSSARNRGIAAASCDWLAFLDSDDQWLPEKLQRQHQALTGQQKMLVCHTDEIWVRNGRRVNAGKKHAKKGGWIFQHCLPLCAMSPSSVMIHREVFASLGGFDEQLPACEDYDLWLRITAHYPVLFIGQPLIRKYGGHEDQLSRKYWGMDRFRIRALEKILATDSLDEADRSAAVAMLREKAGIYLQGAIKRGKSDEIGYYRQLLSHYKT